MTYQTLLALAALFFILAAVVSMMVGVSVGQEKYGRPRILAHQVWGNLAHLRTLVREERQSGGSVQWRLFAGLLVTFHGLAALSAIAALVVYLAG